MQFHLPTMNTELVKKNMVPSFLQILSKTILKLLFEFTFMSSTSIIQTRTKLDKIVIYLVKAVCRGNYGETASYSYQTYLLLENTK